MKTHTSNFKEQIKLMGKEIDSRITFGSTVLGKNDLNAVTPSYQGAILKSVMKQLDIDSNVEIPIGTILKYEFGLKVNGEYEYINYGNYVVYSIEKQEDTKSYKITCYDKLLYSMLDYVKLPITYPISIRDYINAISTALGLKFANKSGTFANYNKQIQADLYDGLGYTFRDILDELAQVTASTICLNNNDELEIRYITETGDTIDEEFLKDVNVNFGEKFGKVNTIVLSRSAGSDNIYYPTVLPTNPYEIKISDNQIMNGNDRVDFLPDIYNKLNGLEFYTNDFVSTGIIYYDLCDRYSVKVGDNTYSCVMLNDEVLVTQGLEENIYTELPKQTETDYKKADTTDRRINQAYILVDKQNQKIEALVETQEDQSSKITKLEQSNEQIKASVESIDKQIIPTATISGSNIYIEDASDDPLIQLEIEGKSEQETRSGKNKFNSTINNQTIAGVELTYNKKNGTITLNGNATESYSGYIFTKYPMNTELINIPANTAYTASLVIMSGTFTYEGAIGDNNASVQFWQPWDKSFQLFFKNVSGNRLVVSKKWDTDVSLSRVQLSFSKGDTFNNFIIAIQLEEGTTATGYEQYGVSPSPDYPSEIVSVGYENLFNKDSITEGYRFESDGLPLSSGYYFLSDYISVNSNSSYIVPYTINWESRIVEYDVDKNITKVIAGGNSFITSSTTKYVRLSNLIANKDIVQLEKGAIAHPIIPYGKYGIEVKTVGKNLFDISKYIGVSTANATVNVLNNKIEWTNLTTDSYFPSIYNQSMMNDSRFIEQLIGVKSSSKYTLSFNTTSSGTCYIYEADKDKNGIKTSSFNIENTQNYTFTTTESTKYIIIRWAKWATQETVTISNIQLEENLEATKYEEHKSNITLFILNNPLRSLPNEVKDIAYIRNNKLYVDRYVTIMILNGSENWAKSTRTDVNRYYVNGILNTTSNRTDIKSICSHFKSISQNQSDEAKLGITTMNTDGIMVNIDKNDTNLDTLEKFKTWLSNNNVQFDYQLATPYTEEIGEIEMPSTFKGVNHISTTDNLEPTLNIEYVRDTTLSNYVEGQINKVMTIEERHYSELVIENDSIRESVESVSSSLDGLNTTINRVEEITTDNSQVINVISTNIDKTSGEVREVTTTTGFTFNADGMTIDDGSGFKAEHTANGTYYKDGNSIVGQYTKDGSKQKDLELFGTYSYGKETIDDTPMFIGQLYTNENGEQAFGHFYNGEG